VTPDSPQPGLADSEIVEILYDELTTLVADIQDVQASLTAWVRNQQRVITWLEQQMS
jgi:hypothetical protein